MHFDSSIETASCKSNRDHSFELLEFIFQEILIMPRVDKRLFKFGPSVSRLISAHQL